MKNYVAEFRKQMKRAPTELEIGALMRIKREQEGFKRIQSSLQTNYKPQRIATPKKPIKSDDGYPRKMPSICKRIDRAIKIGMDVSKIAYVEESPVENICNLIGKWKLPRYEVQQ